MHKDFELNFSRFSPGPGLEAYANLEVGKLMDIAPDGASCTSTIEATGDLYMCRLAISAITGPFYVTVFAENPQLALSRAISKMKEKIKAWKNERFERARLRTPKHPDLSSVAGTA